MGFNFRIAIGSGKCKGIERRKNALMAAVCDGLCRRLEYLRGYSRLQLLALPEYEAEPAWVEGNRVLFETHRCTYDDESALVVVRAFVPTIVWPTFFSPAGVGHAVAEGLVVSPTGEVTDAPDEDLWEFR